MLAGVFTMSMIESVTMIGPVVWGSVWGHGPELARYLSRGAKVKYFNPVVPVGASAPSFAETGAYPELERVEIIRRSSRFRPGVLYGLAMEWQNLLAAARSNPDCLVSYYPLGSVLALLWCRLKRKRSVFVFADFPEILRSRLARFLARRLFLAVTARLATAGCVATSRLLLEDIQKISPKSILVPNGVDLSAITGRPLPGSIHDSGKERSTFTAGFVGYFGEWVDFEPVFQAARQCPEINFLIIGEGQNRARLAARAGDLKNIDFTGTLPHAEVFMRIAAMDVCLIPFVVNRTTDRVSPVKLFEYWAMGKPVLATRCLELRRIAETAPQALCFYSGGEGLAQTLTGFLNDRQRLGQASEEALRVVGDYDWEKLGERILRFIESGPSSSPGSR